MPQQEESGGRDQVGEKVGRGGVQHSVSLSLTVSQGNYSPASWGGKQRFTESKNHFQKHLQATLLTFEPCVCSLQWLAVSFGPVDLPGERG